MSNSIQTFQVPVEGGRALAIREQGAGPAVVLIHGIPGSAASWLEVASRLASRHRVLVPDLIGFGGSSRSCDTDVLHAKGQAGALHQALEALSIERATFVGHDFGGPVALSLWARAPVRMTGLGLLSTNAFTDTPIPFPLSCTTWPVVGAAARRALFSSGSLRMMLRQGVGRPKVAIDPTAAIGDAGQARAIASIFSASLLRLADLYRPIEHALPTVSVPTLVAWGDRDPFFSVEQGRRTARAIAGSRFEVLEGAGHFLPEERPGEIAGLVAELGLGGRVDRLGNRRPTGAPVVEALGKDDRVGSATSPPNGPAYERNATTPSDSKLGRQSAAPENRRVRQGRRSREGRRPSHVAGRLRLPRGLQARPPAPSNGFRYGAVFSSAHVSCRPST